MKLQTTKSPAWHADRMLGIGASEAAAALGLDPYKDRITWWSQKTGLEPPDDETLPMRLGTLMEPIIGALYEEQTGLKLRRPPKDRRTGEPRAYANPDHPFIRAHLDFRIVGANGLVEAKHPDRSDAWGEPEEDGVGEGIPIQYRVQAYVEMLATGADWVDVAALFGNRRFAIYPLVRDQAILNDLAVELEDAWGYVQRQEMPPPTAGSGPALRRRFPVPSGDYRVASAEQEEPIRELLAASILRKQAETHEDLAENVVKAMIGEALGIEGAGVRVTWGPRKGSISWKSVAETYRGTVEAFQKALAERNASIESRQLWDALIRSLELIDTAQLEEATRGEPSRTLTIAKLR